MGILDVRIVARNTEAVLHEFSKTPVWLFSLSLISPMFEDLFDQYTCSLPLFSASQIRHLLG